MATVQKEYSAYHSFFFAGCLIIFTIAGLSFSIRSIVEKKYFDVRGSVDGIIINASQAPYLLFPDHGVGRNQCDTRTETDMRTQRRGDTFTIAIGGHRWNENKVEGAMCSAIFRLGDKEVPIEQPEQVKQIVFILKGKTSRYRFVQREPGIYDMEPLDNIDTINVRILPSSVKYDHWNFDILIDEYYPTPRKIPPPIVKEFSI